MLTLLILASAALISTPAPAQERQADVTRSAVLMLQPRGFEPSSLTVKPGPLQIRVYNRIGPRDLPLRLDRVDRDGQQQEVLTPLRQETLARQQRKWDNHFNLAAGQYRVSIEGQPRWTCTITIAPEAPR